MLPKTHFLFGILLSFILVYFFDFSLVGGIIIVLATVLIDVDHYLYYVYLKKDWNLKNAFSWFVDQGKKLDPLTREQRNEFYHGFCFLHGVEVLMVLYLLGIFISPYFLFVLFGFAFHLGLDLIHQKTIYDRIDKFSLIYDYFKFKKLKFIEELEELSGLK